MLPPVFNGFFLYNNNIHSYPTRACNNIHLRNPKILLAHKSLRHHGPDIWNSLPDSIKENSTLTSFIKAIKTIFLDQYAKRWNFVLLKILLQHLALCNILYSKDFYMTFVFGFYFLFFVRSNFLNTLPNQPKSQRQQRAKLSPLPRPDPLPFLHLHPHLHQLHKKIYFCKNSYLILRVFTIFKLRLPWQPLQPPLQIFEMHRNTMKVTFFLLCS